MLQENRIIVGGLSRRIAGRDGFEPPRLIGRPGGKVREVIFGSPTLHRADGCPRIRIQRIDKRPLTRTGEVNDLQQCGMFGR